jgi:hypothetical protein
MNQSGVSHVRPPAAALVFQHTQEAIPEMIRAARSELARFEEDGTVKYRPSPNALDYGRTHFADHANGHTAASLLVVLRAAAFTGDPELRRAGMRLLRHVAQSADRVPRGAQTWEIPLHTPDILASAYLVNCFVLGHHLTGERGFLEEARYWAWTGIPFVYLVNPGGPKGASGAVEGEIGLYSTIAVLGATQWKAPNWMGLPVQWCGLVYADALYSLFDVDRSGPWKRVADGITASGIRQVWPLPHKPGGDKDRQGLLPDSVSLRAQIRNDAAINPGTLQANVPRLFGRPPLYGLRAFRNGAILAHAPGAITKLRDGSTVEFTVEAWTDRPYESLIVGLPRSTRVSINGKVARFGDSGDAHEWNPDSGRLILRLSGKARVRLANVATPSQQNPPNR